MSTNQPKSSQPTQATLFLWHLLLSFVVGILAAVFTALVQYIATSGNSINLSYILTVSGVAFTTFVAAFLKRDVVPHEAEIIQGIRDEIASLHSPLLTQIVTLTQQIAALQAAQQPVISTPFVSTTASPATVSITHSVPTQTIPDITTPLTAIQTSQQAGKQ